MTTANPFQQTMVRMQLPPGMGRNISARGFTLDADEKGTIVVPKDVADELLPHGLTVVPEQPAKK